MDWATGAPRLDLESCFFHLERARSPTESLLPLPPLPSASCWGAVWGLEQVALLWILRVSICKGEVGTVITHFILLPGLKLIQRAKGVVLGPDHWGRSQLPPVIFLISLSLQEQREKCSEFSRREQAVFLLPHWA